jgi:hypothetical protein
VWADNKVSAGEADELDALAIDLVHDQETFWAMGTRAL